MRLHRVTASGGDPLGVDSVHINGIPVPLSRVVMGTDWLGARRFVYVRGRRFSSPFVDRAAHRANLALLDGVAEAGCTAFDTARAYGDSERTLGEWLQVNRLRDRVALITKGGHPGPGWRPRLSPDAITRDLEQSLKALRTDYVDLYLLHYDDASAEVEPLIDVLNRHRSTGRIRALGVSNWSTARITMAMAYAGRTHQQPPVVSSVQYSLATWNSPPWQGAVSIGTDHAAAERDWYKRHELCILAYSSLAMGFFSPARSYGAATDPSTASRFGDRVFLNDRNRARLERAHALARQLGVTPGQIALAWVLGFDRRLLPIVGARSAASYREAADACEIALSDAQRRWLLDGT
jgi:aryl-alcohol dehydrogenase-like predicted oxidoreductase